MEDSPAIYKRLKQTPFPELGKRVGHFPLFNALLAGCASRAAQGLRVEATEVPEPDEGTRKQAEMLRQKEHLLDEEREFLEYLNLLDHVRALLVRS